MRGLRQKSFDWEENFKHYHKLFCHDLRTFWKIWVKKVFFGTTTAFPGQEMHYYMVNIAYYTEFAIMRKNDAFVARIANTRPTKIFVGFFALVERMPTSATL